MKNREYYEKKNELIHEWNQNCLERKRIKQELKDLKDLNKSKVVIVHDNNDGKQTRMFKNLETFCEYYEIEIEDIIDDEFPIAIKEKKLMVSIEPIIIG